jgi:hypothetical protein
MDGLTVDVDVRGKPRETAKVVVLRVSLLAATLGVISLGAGMHRISLAQICACAAGACFAASGLWTHRWWQAGAVVLSIGAIAGFFLGIR